nr:30S ribosomal protein S12 methylthiotransferase RimO [Treponema primitia]
MDPFGCVKNQVDAETMMAVLENSGWRQEEAEDADLIIVNSCAFIESAKQESINAVLGYRKLYPGKKILLAGCLAQRYAETLAGELGEADMIFGNGDLSRIHEAAKAAMASPGLSGGAPGDNPRTLVPPVPASGLAGGFSGSSLPGSPEEMLLTGERPLLSLPGSAYVKISEGCNNRCTFCAIPGIRGPLRSRAAVSVLEECRRLLDRDVQEICLIGQDLGSYGTDLAGGPVSGRSAESLPELLEAIATLPGRFWVRLLYIHPDNFPRPILDLIRRDSRFLPYFDLPFQHGSAATLRAMNRRGSAEAYLDLIAEIRTLPDAVIRSTFLTGFPGETEEDFQALLDFQAKAQLDWAGVFTYSREEDTPAYSMKHRVPKKIAAQRKFLIEEQQTGITEKRMDRFVGRTLDVLVEEAVDEAEAGESGPGEEGLYLGRLYCQAPEIDGSAVIRSEIPLIPGAFVRGRVFARAGVDLEVTVSQI